MKRPRKVMRYCAGQCKKHTEHDVERLRKKRASELAWGQRRFRRVTAGYRGFPRPKPEGREKPTKRITLRYKCTACTYQHQPAAKRSKRFELTE